MRRIVDWSVGDCEWMHYICARVEIAQAKENTAAKKKGRGSALIIKFLATFRLLPSGYDYGKKPRSGHETSSAPTAFKHIAMC